MLLEVVIGTGILDMVFGRMGRWVVLGVVLLGVLAFSMCGGSYQWNQKLTLVVQTPSGELSGASVVHVTAKGGGKAPFTHDGGNSSTTVIGEAAMVDLGGGRYLFALLQGANPENGFKGSAEYIAEFAFWPGMAEPGNGPGMAEGFAYVEGLPAGTSMDLTSDNYPMLVTFADINDPKTVQRVDPANLAATFGPGFALKDIRLEITGEKATIGAVKKVLAWENALVGSIGKQMKLPYQHFLNQINDGSFSRGDQK